MRLLGWPALLLAAAYLHWFFAWWMVLGATPHFALVLTVVIALRLGAPSAMTFGFLAGLAVDALGARLFGANALALTLVGYGTGMLRRQMDTTLATSQMALLAILSWAHFALVGLVSLVFVKTWGGGWWKGLLLVPLYNALLAPFGFSVVERLRGPSRLGGQP